MVPVTNLGQLLRRVGIECSQNQYAWGCFQSATASTCACQSAHKTASRDVCSEYHANYHWSVEKFTFHVESELVTGEETIMHQNHENIVHNCDCILYYMNFLVLFWWVAFLVCPVSHPAKWTLPESLCETSDTLVLNPLTTLHHRKTPRKLYLG